METKYITVLDNEFQYVIQYEVLEMNDEYCLKIDKSNGFLNIEDFLLSNNHSLGNIDYMVHGIYGITFR